MQFRCLPGARSVALGVIVTCATLAATASAAWAWSYTAVVTPASVASGSTTKYNVLLTNTSAGNPLGSAVIRPPGKFTLTGASLGTTTGNLTLDPNRVVLTGLKLPPGGSVNVSVTAIAASKCKTYNWQTEAYAKGLASTPLDFDGGHSSVTTTVTCSSTPNGLEFATQPSNSMVNQDITPPVTVQLVGAGDAPVAAAGVPVTLALDNDPGLGTLSGTLTEPTNASGVATFSDLQIDEPGFGYTLAASSPGLTGATSDPFNESNSETTTCTSDPCTTDVSSAISDMSISTTTAAGTLTENVDVGSPLSCADEANGGYTGFDTNTYQFFEETGTADKTIVYTIDGVSSDNDVEMCFGATYEFVTNEGGEAASGTLPDGTTGFVGLLPDCDDEFDGIGPCIESRQFSTDDVDFVVVTVQVPGLTDEGTPGDPAIHG
jgi:hypothetical protein